jgi:YfiH family protein
VPAIVYDPVQHAFGLAHAGWRGTVGNIAGKLVAAMSAEFGSNPADLVVKLGPSIGPCCYEVGDEVISAWLESELDPACAAVRPASPRAHLDLWHANSLAFEASGVPANQIEHAGLCTRCQADRFFSRRAGQGHRGLFATIGQLRPRPSSDERQRGQ